MAKQNKKKGKKNTGIDYELTIQAIYQNILKLKGLKNISVLHNQDIDGKSLHDDGKPIKHQIDVYWEFELAGELHCCIIQAKDWTRAVSLGSVLTFKAVRDEMIRPCKAIMVTKKGVQKSALAYAKAHDIEIVVLRPAKEEEVTGLIQHILGSLLVEIPDYSDLSIEIDYQWLHSLGVPIPEKMTLFAGRTDQMMLFNDAGEKWSFHEQFHRMLASKEAAGETVEANKPLALREKFSDPVYVHRDDPAIPRIKIDAVGAVARVYREEHTIAIDFPITLILQSITGTDQFFVDDNLNVRTKGS